MLNLRTKLLIFFVFFIQLSATEDCGAPKHYPNTVLQNPKYSPGARVYYSCALGYMRVAGLRFVRCVKGQWTPLTMKCDRKPCGSAGEILNGHFEYTEQEPLFGDEIMAVCKEGYQLRGDRYRLCQHSGWKGKIPTCREGAEITCPSPSLANGMMIKGDAAVYYRGSKVTFNCTDGFYLRGFQEITCRVTSEWIPKVPECVPLIMNEGCSAPPNFPTMLLADHYLLMEDFPPGSQVRYTCALGYTKSRGNIAISRCENKRWTPVNLKCEPTEDCGAPKHYPNTVLQNPKYSPGARVYYSCALGYMRVAGLRFVRCVKGQWTPLTMKCDRKPCGSAGEILNGHFEYTEQEPLFGDEIMAVCKEGYQLRGDRYRLCQDSGWKGKIPICREGAEITCPSPSLANGMMIKGDAAVYYRGSKVTFNCTDGFYLRGSEEITCRVTSEWIPKVPECVHLIRNVNLARSSPFPSMKHTDVDLSQGRAPEGCSAPPNFPTMLLADHYLLMEDFPPGSQVRYTCALGYTKSRGNIAISRCENKRWTPVNLKCERISCGSAGEILNGYYKYSGALFGDTVHAVCNEGFIMIGRDYRQCRNQGWDGTTPICEAVKCADPPEVVNGERTGQMDGPFTYNTAVLYQCLKGQLIGERWIYCTKDGIWSAPPPKYKTCSYASMQYGRMTTGRCPHYKYGDYVSIQCNVGYRWIGPSKVMCRRNGIPLSQNVVRELPLVTPNGIFSYKKPLDGKEAFNAIEGTLLSILVWAIEHGVLIFLPV